MWRLAGKGACRVKFEMSLSWRGGGSLKSLPAWDSRELWYCVMSFPSDYWYEHTWWYRELQMIFPWMLLISPSSCLPMSCSPASRSCSLVLQACQSSSCYVVFLLLHQGCRSNCCFDALFSLPPPRCSSNLVAIKYMIHSGMCKILCLSILINCHPCTELLSFCLCSA